MQHDRPARPFNTGRFSCRHTGPFRDISHLAHDDRLNLLEDAREGDALELFGYKLVVDTAHVRPSALAQWRGEGDDIADAAIAALVRDRARKRAASASSSSSPSCPFFSTTTLDDLEALAARVVRPPSPESDAASSSADEADDVRAAAAFLADVRAVPLSLPPSEWGRVERGQAFFARNAAGCGICLLNLSLIGGFGASDINKVLEGTGYLSSHNRDAVHRRLLETLSFVIDVSEGGREGLSPGGKGWRSCCNVRLMHASVRLRLLERGGPWGTPSQSADTTTSSPSSPLSPLGLPINQEDLVVTQLAFSLVVLLGLERAGLAWHVSDAEMEDYLRLWALVGRLLGIRDDRAAHMASLPAAQKMLESIVSHVAHADDSSRRLVMGCVRSVAYRLPFLWSMRSHVAVCRALAGEAYADSIGIPRLDDEALREEVVDEDPTTAFPGELLWVKAGVLPRDTGVVSSVVSSAGATAARVVVWTALRGVGVAMLLWDWSPFPWLLGMGGGRKGRREEGAARADGGGGGGGSGGEAEGEALLQPLRLFPYLLSLPLVGTLLAKMSMAHLRHMLDRRLGGPVDFRVKSFPRGGRE
jgi:hypothetical protein